MLLALVGAKIESFETAVVCGVQLHRRVTVIAVLQSSTLAVAERLIWINLILLLLIVGASAGAAWIFVRRGLRQRVGAARMAAMGTATARILHQIKNPLQTVLLHAEMLADDRLVEDRSVRQEVCEAIMSEALRVTDLLTELSSYASGVSRKVEPQPLELGEFIEATLHSLVRESAQDGTLVVADPIVDLEVDADPYFLQQALENVVRNACEALESLDPEAERRVEISVRPRGTEVSIDVRDTGSGIDPSEFGAVQEPFVTAKSKGMGLGLPICREIIEAHGGRLELRSKPDVGTTVSLILPVSSQRSKSKEPA